MRTAAAICCGCSRRPRRRRSPAPRGLQAGGRAGGELRRVEEGARAAGRIVDAVHVADLLGVRSRPVQLPAGSGSELELHLIARSLAQSSSSLTARPASRSCSAARTGSAPWSTLYAIGLFTFVARSRSNAASRMTMGTGHAEAVDRVALKVEFDQHRRRLADHPAVVAGIDRDDLRRLVLHDAAVGVPDVDLAAREKADVGMHAECGTDYWLHVDGPAEPGRIDHALHTRRAGTRHLELHVPDLTARRPLHGGDERILRPSGAPDRSSLPFSGHARLADLFVDSLLLRHVPSRCSLEFNARPACWSATLIRGGAGRFPRDLLV